MFMLMQRAGEVISIGLKPTGKQCRLSVTINPLLLNTMENMVGYLSSVLCETRPFLSERSGQVPFEQTGRFEK